MEFEIFLFGLVMLVLIALTAYLVVRAMRSSEKPAEIEHRMRELYVRMDELLDATEAYVEESKEEIEARLEYIESLVYKLENTGRSSDYTVYEEVVQRPEPPKPKPKKSKFDSSLSSPKSTIDEEFSSKIRELSGTGATPGNIAEELGSSKGAVEFVLNLMGKDKK